MGFFSTSFKGFCIVFLITLVNFLFTIGVGVTAFLSDMENYKTTDIKEMWFILGIVIIVIIIYFYIIGRLVNWLGGR